MPDHIDMFGMKTHPANSVATCVAWKALLKMFALFLITFTPTGQAYTMERRGSVELGMDVGGQVHNAQRASAPKESEVIIAPRVGFFLADKTELESHVRFDLFSGEFRLGVAFGLTYHFVRDKHTATPYIGTLTTLNRRRTPVTIQEQYGLGLVVGVKALHSATAQRFEAFVVRRFSNIAFASETVFGLNIGFSGIFKKFSAWDQ